MMKRLVSLTLLAGLLALAPQVQASSDTRWVARDWETPYTQMSTRLWMNTPNADGTEGSVSVYVNVILTDEAALRIGEVEEWQIRGQYWQTGSNGRVDVTLQPSRFYHQYPTYLTRSVSVWGSGSQTVYFYVGHDGRVEDGAAPSIDQAKVDYTTLDAPWNLSFRDFGFEENGSAATSYQFSVARRPGLWGDEKLVARGEVARTETAKQAIVVEKDGEYTADADEWFKEGKKYVVRVRVKRVGTPWYTDAYGDPFVGVFEWDSQAGALRRVAEHDLLTPRQQAFQALHP